MIVTMRKIKQIIVHCSATGPQMDIGASDIDQWHKAKGWAAIGYNYVIRRDGTLENGRDLDGDGNVDEEMGAHAYGFNANSIGICLAGGVDEKGKPDPNFTPEQWQTLAAVVRRLTKAHPEAVVLGHRDLPGVRKACPSFDVKPWWKNLCERAS